MAEPSIRVSKYAKRDRVMSEKAKEAEIQATERKKKRRSKASKCISCSCVISDCKSACQCTGCNGQLHKKCIRPVKKNS